jgi:hypothetical protein
MKIKKFIVALLLCLVFVWYLFLNRYQTLFLQEQTQMFRFTQGYFLQYLSRPGGITAYLGAFLTQFFYFRVVGAGIYTLVFFAFYRIFKVTLNKLSVFSNSFFVPFIPALLFLPASTGFQFCIADELCVLIALAGFIGLVKVAENKYRYLLIPCILFLLYLLVAGNVLLSVILFLFYFVRHKQKGGKVKLGRKWALFADIGLAVVITGWVVKSYQTGEERILKMTHDADANQWTDVLATAEKANTGLFQCFYLNLALQQTGQMADKMFRYNQIGLPGLLIEPQDNFSCHVLSDFFYHLGLINETNHYAYESMVGYSYFKEPDIRNMKRLLECAVSRKDTALTQKYQNMMDKTLFYKSNGTKTGTIPAEVHPQNSFVNDRAALLEAILESKPDHRIAFEYLMAYYMLEREFEKAKKCFDTYYSGFAYPSIPVHYSELLVLYKNLNGLDDGFYKEYPVSVEIRERFDMMDGLLPLVETDLEIQKLLEAQFKDTYWFYVRFPLIAITKTSANEKNIY